MSLQPITNHTFTRSLVARAPREAWAKLRRWVGDHVGDRIIKLASVVTLIGLWYLGAALLPPSIMPAPHVVGRVLWHNVMGRAIWIDVAITMTRIVFAFAIAMSIALVLGFAMGLSKSAERFFDVWVVGGISLPSLVVMLTVYMIVGLNDRAAVIAAALPVIPVLTINIWEGIKGVDQKLIDMAKAYHADRLRIIVSVVAPQIMPIMIASARFGLGLIWKMVLFVELLGRSDGVGYKIEYYYQMFNMSEVLAHALLFLLIMIFIEIILLGKLERYLFSWRPAQRRF